MRIIESPHLTIVGEVSVRIPRRGIWRRVVRQIPDPNVYMIGDTVMCHPSVAQRIREEIVKRMGEYETSGFLRGAPC